MEVFGGKPRIHQIVSHTFLNSYEEKVYFEEASDLSNGADSSRTEHQPEMDFPLYCLAICSVKGGKSFNVRENMLKVDLFIDGSRARQSGIKSSLEEMPEKQRASQG